MRAGQAEAYGQMMLISLALVSSAEFGKKYAAAAVHYMIAVFHGARLKIIDKVATIDDQFLLNDSRQSFA